MFAELKTYHQKFKSVFEPNVLCNKLYLSSLSQKINNNKIFEPKARSKVTKKIKCCDMSPALKTFHKKFISVYEPYTLPVIIFTKK